MGKIKNEYLLLIIAIAWVFFFSFVLQLHPEFTLKNDEGSYYSAAERLYLHGIPDDGRPLLISAINGFPMLFGYSGIAVFKWILGVNLVCWFLTALMIYKIASEELHPKKGFFIALIFLSCVGNLMMAYKLLSESVFLFLLILAVYLIHKSINGRYEYVSLATAVLFLAVLVKPLAMGLGLLLLVWHFRKLKEILWNKFSVFLYVSLSLVFFQMYAIKRHYGDFTVSYIDSFTYYNYLGAKADCYRKGIDYVQAENERYAYFAQFPSHEQRQIASDDFKEQLQNNSGNLLKAYLSDFYSNASKGSPFISERENKSGTAYFDVFRMLFKILSKVQNIVFTLLGITMSALLLLRKKCSAFYSVISVVALYIFTVSAISCDQGDRFHMVIYPIVLLQVFHFWPAKFRFLNH